VLASKLSLAFLLLIASLPVAKISDVARRCSSCALLLLASLLILLPVMFLASSNVLWALLLTMFLLPLPLAAVDGSMLLFTPLFAPPACNISSVLALASVHCCCWHLYCVGFVLIFKDSFSRTTLGIFILAGILPVASNLI
jgi:hypothetical protein